MEQQQWADVMRQALVGAAVVVLLTVWWVSESFVLQVMLLAPVAAGVGWLMGAERLWPLWRRAGLVLVGALVAALVAVTGGGESVYQDLFLVVILGAALVADDARTFVGGAVVAVLGAATPALYEDVDRIFVADTVADVLVWISVGTVTWRIAEGRARHERERAALLQRYVTVAEDERERLADDLHDDAIQLLSAARLRVQAASRSDDSTDLEIAHGLLADGLLSLRRLILELKSPDIGTGSLEELVQAYVERVLPPTGVAADLRITLPDGVHRDVATAAYRIIVEALSNVARHSGASTVTVTVAVEDGCLVGRVRDDGRGLPDEIASRPGHIGLRSMRDRAEVLGGRAGPRSIPTGDGGGTEVAFSLPLQRGT